MSQATALLNELVEIARDGERFYDEAARKVHSDELRTIFRQQSDVRRKLMDALGEAISRRGETPSSATTLAGDMRRAYAAALAKMGDKDETYVDQLEQMEDRLLEHYRQALDAAAPGGSVRTILTRQRPAVEAAHERMRRLQALAHSSERAGT